MKMNEWSILVVEDEPDGQEVVAGLLNHFHISSTQAMSAEVALDLLAQDTYTAVLIDIALPGMDGFELLEAIRSDERVSHLPCIAFTAYHSSLVKQRAVDAGFDAYFAKPLEDTAFIRALDNVINN